MTKAIDKNMTPEQKSDMAVCEHCMKILLESFKTAIFLASVTLEVDRCIEEKQCFPLRVKQAKDACRSSLIDLTQLRFRIEKKVEATTAANLRQHFSSMISAITNAQNDLEQDEQELNAAIARWNTAYPVNI